MIKTTNLQQKYIHNQQIAYFYKLKELRIFLQRIIKRNIILQSNFKKGIDRDLLIIQQTRNLKTKLKQIDNETRNYELKLKNETKQSKSKAVQRMLIAKKRMRETVN